MTEVSHPYTASATQKSRIFAGISNSGEFGNVVHARAVSKITGDGWIHNVWVHHATRQIVQIGGTSPTGYLRQDLIEIDTVRLKLGISKSVGEKLESVDIERIYEIKSRVSNSGKSQIQMERLSGLNPVTPPKLVQGSRIYSMATGWGDNPSFVRWKKLLAIAGGASVAIGAGTAVLAFAHSEEEATEFRREIEPILVLIENSRDDNEKKLNIIDGIDAIKKYISKFLIDDQPADFVTLFTVYRVMGSGGA